MLNELIESEKSDMEKLRALRLRHNDAETQRLVAELLEEKTERVIKLHELLRYKDGDDDK